MNDHITHDPRLPFDTILVEDRDSWRWMRCCGLGGSDAAVVLGISPWRTIADLRFQKKRNPRGGRSTALRFGLYIEPFIFDRLAREDSRPMTEGAGLGTLISKERRWQLANLDGYIGNLHSSDVVGLEIKHTTAASLDRWADGPPADYVAQLQHYMAVTGWSSFELHCLVVQDDRRRLFQHIDHAHDPDAFTHALVDKTPMLSFHIERDDDYIERMCELEARVWRWIQG